MANIKKHLDNIKGALFGKEVRSSIHDGIDAINKEVESTTNRQEHLEGTFDQLIINSGNSNAEIVDARVGENGKSYAKLGDRLDEVDSQLEHKASKSELEVERKRIDTFTSLSEGSTTGDAELIDVRIGYDGTIHSNAGTSIRSQVKEANENINNKIKKSINLLDNSKWIKGYYVSQQIVDGVKKLVKTEHDDFSYIEIQVKANTSYTVSKYAHQIAFGKYVEGEFVLRTAIGTGQTVNESFTFETYTTDTTIYINKRNSQKFVMLIEGRECPKYFIECGNEVIRDIDKPLEWHIGVGKDFETFTECIRFLKDDEREKTIYIHQGDYDIFNELGGSFYAKSFTQDDTNNWDDIVDWIPPNTNIIGIGKVRLIYTPLEQNTNKYASRIFSTINTRGTCTIDNIEIRCKNGRYCIHDETGSDDRFTGAIKRFKNLKCIHLASDDSVASMHQCVGGGLHKSMFIEYENCYFESHHPKYGNVFSYHNSNSTMEMKDSSRINIKDCIFLKNENNPNATVRFGNCNNTLTDIKVNINSSYINGSLSITNEFSSPSLTNAFNVTLLNCNDISTSIDATNNQYNVKIYK